MITYITCTKRLTFCAGHRLPNHPGPCSNLHGHNYAVEITAQSIENTDKLDEIGRVIDFSCLKDVVGTWIDQWWDHGFLLHDGDEVAITALQYFGDKADFSPKGSQQQKWYSCPWVPTAENMADFLLTRFDGDLCPFGVRLVQVKLWETETCHATAKRDLDHGQEKD